jgi:hypothetical protein
MSFIRLWFTGYHNPAKMVGELESKPAPYWGFYKQLLRAAFDSLLLHLPLALMGRVPPTRHLPAFPTYGQVLLASSLALPDCPRRRMASVSRLQPCLPPVRGQAHRFRPASRYRRNHRPCRQGLYPALGLDHLLDRGIESILPRVQSLCHKPLWGGSRRRRHEEDLGSPDVARRHPRPADNPHHLAIWDHVYALTGLASGGLGPRWRPTTH